MEPHGQARGTFLIDPLHRRLKISPKFSAHASGLSALASLAAESAGVPRLLVRIQHVPPKSLCDFGDLIPEMQSISWD